MADIFWLNKADFQPVAKVASPAEMVEALKRAPPTVVRHHINNGRNDFANWAKNSLRNADLASRLAKINSSDPKAIEHLIEAFSAKKK